MNKNRNSEEEVALLLFAALCFDGDRPCRARGGRRESDLSIYRSIEDMPDVEVDCARPLRVQRSDPTRGTIRQSAIDASPVDHWPINTVIDLETR